MKPENKFSLFKSCGIAVGGIIGGGIFAVLGEAVVTASNATFISLGLGGLLALITGLVYAELTTLFDESGGEFIFIEHITSVRFAGTVSWFLLLGYIFTMSLYAYAFGAYGGRLLGFGSGPNFWLSGAIVILLIGRNIFGLKRLHIAEHKLLGIKLGLLFGLIGIGSFSVHPGKITPILNQGLGNTLKAGALVFVAFEGFQLLTYDYHDLKNHRSHLRKVVTVSIIFVVAIYMAIAFTLTGSLSPQVIITHKETVVAMLAEPIFGRPGIDVVLAAAVFNTTIALSITIFVITEQAKKFAGNSQLPHQLMDWRRSGTPVYFSIFMAVLAVLVLYFANLELIMTLASLTFLVVFAIVNFMGYRYKIFNGWKRLLPLTGSMGCVAGAGVLLYEIYISGDIITLYIITGITITTMLFREAYIWFHSKYKGESDETDS